jgi:hypothetical protein
MHRDKILSSSRAKYNQNLPPIQVGVTPFYVNKYTYQIILSHAFYRLYIKFAKNTEKKRIYRSVPHTRCNTIDYRLVDGV